MTTAKATRIVGSKDLVLYTFTKDDIKKLVERLERDHGLAELEAALYGITKGSSFITLSPVESIRISPELVELLYEPKSVI